MEKFQQKWRNEQSPSSIVGSIIYFYPFKIEKIIMIFLKEIILIYNGSFQIIMVRDLIEIRLLYKRKNQKNFVQIR